MSRGHSPEAPRSIRNTASFASAIVAAASCRRTAAWLLALGVLGAAGAGFAVAGAGNRVPLQPAHVSGAAAARGLLATWQPPVRRDDAVHAAAAPDPADLTNYCLACYTRLGITKEQVDSIGKWVCNKGTSLPTTVEGVNKDGGPDFPDNCDRPVWLGSPIPKAQCYGHSYVQKFVLNKGAATGAVTVVLTCRHKSRWSGLETTYDDINLIMHNEENGQTCWFNTPESKTDARDGSDVPKPHAGAIASDGKPYWLPASAAASFQCISCHDNGPWMNSRWMRNSGIALRDRPREKYVNEGDYFADWEKPKTITVGATSLVARGSKRCTACHRIAAAKVGTQDFQTAAAWFDFTVGRSNAPQNNTTAGRSFDEKYWMPVGHDEANATDFDATYKKHINACRECMQLNGKPTNPADPCDLFPSKRVIDSSPERVPAVARTVFSGSGLHLYADVGASHYDLVASADSDLAPVTIPAGSSIHVGWDADADHPVGGTEVTLPPGVAFGSVHTGTNWDISDPPQYLGPLLVPGDYRFDFDCDDTTDYGHVNLGLVLHVSGTPQTVLRLQAIADSLSLGEAFDFPFPSMPNVNTTTDGTVPVWIGWGADNVMPGSSVLTETISGPGSVTNTYTDESGFQPITTVMGAVQTYVLSAQGLDGGAHSVSLNLTVGGATATLLGRLDAEPGVERVTLHWSVGAGAAATGVVIYRAEGLGSMAVRLNAAPIPVDGRSTYAFVDRTVASGRAYIYTLAFVDRSGQESRAGQVTVRTLGARLALTLPSANPTRGPVELLVAVPGEAPATVEIVDVGGRVVARPFEGTLPVGEHPLVWDANGRDGRAAASGVYFAVLRSAGQRRTQRIVLQR